MQLKLLNFHKMLANFAVNIISVFIPLILYTYTNNILFSLIYLITQYIFRISVTVVFRKLIEKRPQVFLLIRIVPMLIYASMVLMLDYNLWLAVILICLFGGISDAFSSFSNEVILNYSSLNKSGKSFGVTRLFEQLGIILSVLMGGLFLDYISKTIVILISITIYSISVLPLLYYYFKFRNSSNFNKEAISNAFLTTGQNRSRSKKAKQISKKILGNYFVLYLMMCLIDSLVNIYNLFVFVEMGAFTFASLISAAYNGAFGISSYIVGKLNDKHDTTIMVRISAAIMSILVVALPFVSNSVLPVVMFAVIGGLYPFSSIFLIERMLVKTRILGISNQALFNRERAASGGKIISYAFGLFGTLLPAFFAIGLVFFSFGMLVPRSEEKTRQLLVGYLEGD